MLVSIVKTLSTRTKKFKRECVRLKLNELGFNHLLSPEEMKSNERDRETRVKRARENMNRDWNRVTFSD